GRHMHMDPFLPNEGAPGRGPHLAHGSVLAIEPMLTLGTTKTNVLDDEWTVVTTDGSRAAHWEHTVAATDDGPRILTLCALCRVFASKAVTAASLVTDELCRLPWVN
ncbi:MAG: methionyl aminopeptidase, partial [Mycobacterium sp.]|nr:methionyl aminopeptidase [Mycobacterium sp.]